MPSNLHSDTSLKVYLQDGLATHWPGTHIAGQELYIFLKFEAVLWVFLFFRRNHCCKDILSMLRVASAIQLWLTVYWMRCVCDYS